MLIFLINAAAVSSFTFNAPRDYSQLLKGDNICRVKAVADNKTLATDAFIAAIRDCSQKPDGGVVFFEQRNAASEETAVYRIDKCIALASNITILIDAATTIQYAITPDTKVDQNPVTTITSLWVVLTSYKLVVVQCNPFIWEGLRRVLLAPWQYRTPLWNQSHQCGCGGLGSGLPAASFSPTPSFALIMIM